MILIQREAPSHWYLRDGRPFHEIAKQDGSGNRPVTLADARKVFALPSVTNVLGVLAKPGLDAWKIEVARSAASFSRNHVSWSAMMSRPHARRMEYTAERRSVLEMLLTLTVRHRIAS